ncbi:MAG: hypothetical protein WDN24_02090 [Sphingomonas sp.]
MVMLADRVGELIGSTLISNLATPSRIADTSWIKPGLTSWDWWHGPVIAKLPGQRTTYGGRRSADRFRRGERASPTR